jgi:hypothetical protein
MEVSQASAEQSRAADLLHNRSAKHWRASASVNARAANLYLSLLSRSVLTCAIELRLASLDVTKDTSTDQPSLNARAAGTGGERRENPKDSR